MSAFAPITVNDGKATPVAHVFSPSSITKDNVAEFADRSTGIAVGYGKLSISVREPTKSSRVFITEIRIMSPTLEVTAPSTATGIQPAPTVAYRNTAILTFLSHERSTLQERKDQRVLSLNALQNALVVAAVDTQEGIY